MYETQLGIVEEIKKVIIEVKKDPTLLPEHIIESTDIVNGIGLDSLQMISFILNLEDVFEIEIDFENFDFDHLTSVRNLSEYISGRLGPNEQ